MMAVPFPLSVKVRPLGSDPDSARAGGGYPVARMVRCSAAPTLVLVAWIFLMAGARVTVRVNAWVAVPFLFLAVRVSGYTPAAAFPGVPEMVAVPSLLSANLTPEGSRPVLAILGAGSPVVVTVNLNAAPNGTVVSEPLVKPGLDVTVAGVIAIIQGADPTVIGEPAVLVAVVIGVTVPEFWLAT